MTTTSVTGMETWRELIMDEMKEHGETWSDVRSMVGSQYFNLPFDASYGSVEGKPFTVWTAKRVYFPVCYDGAEACGSVSIVPDGKATFHMGR